MLQGCTRQFPAAPGHPARQSSKSCCLLSATEPIHHPPAQMTSNILQALRPIERAAGRPCSCKMMPASQEQHSQPAHAHDSKPILLVTQLQPIGTVKRNCLGQWHQMAAATAEQLLLGAAGCCSSPPPEGAGRTAGTAGRDSRRPRQAGGQVGAALAVPLGPRATAGCQIIRPLRQGLGAHRAQSPAQALMQSWKRMRPWSSTLAVRLAPRSWRHLQSTASTPGGTLRGVLRAAAGAEESWECWGGWHDHLAAPGARIQLQWDSVANSMWYKSCMPVCNVHAAACAGSQSHAGRVAGSTHCCCTNRMLTCTGSTGFSGPSTATCPTGLKPGGPTGRHTDTELPALLSSALHSSW